MELPSDALIGVADALDILDRAPVHPRIETRSILDCQGLILARSISADRDFPAFDKSLLDGFAVRAGDVSSAPIELLIQGEIAAGTNATETLQTGQAMAIMTGAPLPDGADAVVPVEETQLVDETRAETLVRILKRPKIAQGIARRASDRPAGEIVLPVGIRLGPAQIAVAASVGTTVLSVYSPPRVGVLATGNEIIPFDQTPTHTQLRNGNSPLLIALLKSYGCEVTDLGLASDDPALIRQAIESAPPLDALFITGGMSMGRYDFVPKILKDLGIPLQITKLRIKPGKPFIFGQWMRQPADSDPLSLFGLPGNPVSAFVCTVRLASRIIRRFQGLPPDPRILRANLLAPLPSNGSREFYQPAFLTTTGLLPLQWKGSADLFTLAQSNALIIRHEHAPALPIGEFADCLEI